MFQVPFFFDVQKCIEPSFAFAFSLLLPTVLYQYDDDKNKKNKGRQFRMESKVHVYTSYEYYAVSVGRRIESFNILICHVSPNTYSPNHV